MASLDPEVLRWVESVVGVGSRVSAVAGMPPSSTAKHAVDVLDAGGRVRRLVLRRYNDKERLASDPWYSPENEARVLEMLERTDVPAPRLYAADLAAAV